MRLCILTVAAETSSGATQLPGPSQMWPGFNQFRFLVHREMCVAVSGAAQETKHFSDLAPRTSFQPLGGAHHQEGHVKVVTSLLRRASNLL